jgi:hypothetical protein
LFPIFAIIVQPVCSNVFVETNEQFYQKRHYIFLMLKKEKLLELFTASDGALSVERCPERPLRISKKNCGFFQGVFHLDIIDGP